MKLHMLWAVLFILVLGALGGGYYLYAQETRALQKLVDAQNQELEEVKESYVQELQNIQIALTQYQLGAENEAKELEQLVTRQENQFQSQLQDIERKKEISEQILTSTNKDLAQNIEELTDKLFTLETNSKTDIVQKWDDIAVRLECNYASGERSFGSGMYLGPQSSVNLGAGNEHAILTNSHVLEENDAVPTSCVLTWNSGEEVTINFDDEGEISRASFFEGFDAAFITLASSDVPLQTQGSSGLYETCEISPQVGDEVIVLGYPKIGSTNSITGTEGIISGYDGNFFITSAKISKGSSGGAAISIKGDCYFGIPTLVKADEVESLGRILDITNIFE